MQRTWGRCPVNGYRIQDAAWSGPTPASRPSDSSHSGVIGINPQYYLRGHWGNLSVQPAARLEARGQFFKFRQWGRRVSTVDGRGLLLLLAAPTPTLADPHKTQSDWHVASPTRTTRHKTAGLSRLDPLHRQTGLNRLAPRATVRTAGHDLSNASSVITAAASQKFKITKFVKAAGRA